MPRSLEEIQAGKKAQTLRREAADLLILYPSVPFIRDGFEFNPSDITRNGRKEECAKYISTIEVMLEEGKLIENPQESKPKTNKRKPKTKAVKPESKVFESITLEVESPEVKEVDTEVKPEIKLSIEPDEPSYSDSETEKLNLAQKLYFSTEKKDGFTGLREYQLELCKSQKYFLPEFAVLVSRARVIIEDYANGKSPEGKAHPGSIQKIRVDVMRYLADIIKPEVSKFTPVNDRTLQDIFDDFDKSVRGAFSDIGAAKYRLNEARNKAAEEDVRAINAYSFIEWAIQVVSNLPDKSSDLKQARKLSSEWKEIAIAVMLLTGRRQSEVMSSGIFTYVDESHVIFEGQLKRHINELVEPEKIPVLGKSAKGVIDAINWLEFYGKRTLPEAREVEAIQKAAKLSHDRCSRYIAETMETLSGYCQIQNNKEWVVFENGKSVNKFKGHLNRQIYAQVCAGLFNDSNDRKKRAYISRILLENREAALSYDRDIEVIDLEKISSLCDVFIDN